MTKKAIIHHTSGTEANPLADTSHHTFEIVDNYHREKWNFKSTLGHYIGYHYFIEKDGSLHQGRQHDELGAHTVGHNDQIGICLAGNFDVTKPTIEQIISLRKLLNKLYRDGDIDGALPHRHYAIKTCYGNNLPDDWADNLIQRRDIKITVVTDRKREFYQLVDWYRDLGIHLHLNVQVIDFSPSWVEEKVEVFKIDENYIDTKLAHYATGSDILALVISKENWKRERSNGYVGLEKRLGLWRCNVQDTGSPRIYHNSLLPTTPQYVSTLIHEIAHILYRESISYDKTHELDKQGKLHEMNIPLYKFKGWEVDNGVRLFKQVNNQIKEKIVYDRQWRMYPSGIQYWKVAGKYSDIIPLIN